MRESARGKENRMCVADELERTSQRQGLGRAATERARRAGCNRLGLEVNGAELRECQQNTMWHTMTGSGDERCDT